MHDLEHLLTILKTGTPEQKGNAITELVKLKDPRAEDALKDVIESEGTVLSMMAQYALCAIGATDVQEVFKTFPYSEIPFLSKLADDFKSVDRLLDVSRSKDARDKMLELLQLYGSFNFSTGISYFDGLLEHGFKRTIGLLLGNLGRAEIQMGNTDVGIDYCNRAIAIGNELGDGLILGNTYGNLGIAYIVMDKYYQALELLLQSIEILGQCTDHAGPIGSMIKKNRMLYNIAIVYHRIGNFEKGREYAENALSVAREEEDTIGTGWALNAVGINHVRLGDSEKAMSFFNDAIDSCIESGDRQTEGTIRMNRGYIFRSRGEFQAAEEALSGALKIFQDTGIRLVRLQ